MNAFRRTVAVAALMTSGLAFAGAAGAGTAFTAKVAFIMTDPLSGSAWTRAWDEARKAVEADLKVKTITVGPIPVNNQAATQTNTLIGEGYNVIVAEDFGYQAFLHKVAKDHPEVKFILIGPNIQKPLPNVATVYANLWQVRYAEGALAGLMTRSNTLGFVTAHNIPSVVAGINGFQIGAHAVNAKAKTIVIETGAWYDPAGATRAAQTLAARGADVIAQHEDDTGALLGAKAAKVWGMGSEADVSSVAPETYLSGSVYNWGPYLEGQLKKMMDGSWKAEDYSGDLASGLVSLGPINAKVPAEVKTRVEGIVPGLKDGSIKVFKGPVTYNTGKTMVPTGKTLDQPGEIYKVQTGFVTGIVGKIK